MILRLGVERCLQCTICEEAVELREKTAMDTEKVLLMIEEMRADHADCKQFEGDPPRAKAERAYKVRMRDELTRLRNGTGRKRNEVRRK